MATDTRPMHQKFGVSALEGIARRAVDSPLGASDISDINRSFGPMLALATSYNDLPEAGTEQAYDNAPTVDPILFRSDLATVKSAFEKAFRHRIEAGGEKFTRDEIAVMKSIERAEIHFQKSDKSTRSSWERALNEDKRRPDHSGALFVSGLMGRYNGRDLERSDRVCVTVDHTMGKNL